MKLFQYESLNVHWSISWLASKWATSHVAQLGQDVVVADPAGPFRLLRAVDLHLPFGIGRPIVGHLPHAGMDEMAPGDFVVQRIGAAEGRALRPRRSLCCMIRFEPGFHLGVHRPHAHAGAMNPISVSADELAGPFVQIAFAGGMVHVEPQVEFVDPLEPARAAAIAKRAVHAVIDLKFARGVVEADRPLVIPRHDGPTWKRLECPGFVLLDRLEIARGFDVVLVRIVRARRIARLRETFGRLQSSARQEKHSACRGLHCYVHLPAPSVISNSGKPCAADVT